MCWAEGSLCRQGEVRKNAKGLDNQCRLTAKQEHLAHCIRWNPHAWQSPVEGLSLVKHSHHESSPGQQVIKKCFQTLLWVALSWIAIHVQGHWGTFANRRVSTYIWLELIFHGCLHFRNSLKQQLITETLRLCFHNIWFPQLFTISNMQLVFALLYSPLIFSYRKAWQQLFFMLPISHFWAPRLMPKKFSRGVDRLMGYTIWYTVHGLTNTKCTRYLKIHKKFIKLGTPTLKIQRRIKSQSISYLFC